MRHGFGYRLLGDRIEHDPLNRLAVERLLLLEHLKHVPGNRLAFAVGIGCQDELIGALGGARDVVEAFLRLVIDFPDHAEIVVRIDRAILGRQVSHMPKRG